MSKLFLAQMLDRLCCRGSCFFDEHSILPVTLPQSGFSVPYYRPEAHNNHIEMIMLLSGELGLHVNGVWTRLADDQPRIFLRGTVHTEHSLSPEQPYLLFWMTSMPGALLLHQTSYQPGEGYGQSAARLSISPPFVGKLWDCGRTLPVDRPRFHYLLMQCIDYSLKNETFTTINYHISIMEQVKKYLDDYYQEKILLDDLAAMTHYSAGHLNALFVQAYGVSIYQYLCRVRIHAAVKLLQDNNLLVKDIAAAVGFTDQLYFSRYFKKLTGRSPRRYAEDLHRKR